MSKRREIAAFLSALALFLLLSWAAGWLLRPNRTEFGSMWDAYLKEPRDSVDVLFFGSSLVYCDIAPAWIWAESGLRSYVMAGPEQTIPISFYYIREACRSQKPQLVMLEVTGMFFEKYQNYTRANIGYMPMTGNRLAATFAAAEPEMRFGLLYPLYDYHSRWTSVTSEELEYNIRRPGDPFAGYTLLNEACAAPAYVERAELTADSGVYRENLLWLQKIRNFCEKEGIALQLFVAPSAAVVPSAAMQTLRTDAASLGLTLSDLNEALPELGVNDDTDWYDNLHFNVHGAEKFSRWLGRFLVETTAVHSGGPDAERWSERLWKLEEAAGA